MGDANSKNNKDKPYDYQPLWLWIIGAVALGVLAAWSLNRYVHGTLALKYPCTLGMALMKSTPWLLISGSASAPVFILLWLVRDANKRRELSAVEEANSINRMKLTREEQKDFIVEIDNACEYFVRSLSGGQVPFNLAMRFADFFNRNTEEQDLIFQRLGKALTMVNDAEHVSRNIVEWYQKTLDIDDELDYTIIYRHSDGDETELVVWNRGLGRSIGVMGEGWHFLGSGDDLEL